MLTATTAYQSLADHAATLAEQHLRDLMMEDDRAGHLVHEVGDLRVDMSRQKLTVETIQLLLQLAEERNLASRISALFAGERINLSEDRSVVHMAQRAPERVEGGEYLALAEFADSMRDGAVDNVINIGIGGSDLGPAMVSATLAHHADGPRVHYVSNVDPSHLHDVLLPCDPARTLVIVTSKTFTTAETMRNAALARHWLGGVGIMAR